MSAGGEEFSGLGLAVEQEQGFDERWLEGGEIGFRFPGDAQGLGAETVDDPVLTGDGFAGAGSGSGVVLGVLAVAFGMGR